ncbi:hypothetical protein FQN57_001093 [Myotisia sp. PD_48]|nr:hypothetical protein FQN57_001093 [Myotisia sp. PD_48]
MSDSLEPSPKRLKTSSLIASQSGSFPRHRSQLYPEWQLAVEGAQPFQDFDDPDVYLFRVPSEGVSPGAHLKAHQVLQPDEDDDAELVGPRFSPGLLLPDELRHGTSPPPNIYPAELLDISYETLLGPPIDSIDESQGISSSSASSKFSSPGLRIAVSLFNQVWVEQPLQSKPREHGDPSFLTHRETSSSTTVASRRLYSPRFNPFERNQNGRHQTLRLIPIAQHGMINGYIKFRLNLTSSSSAAATTTTTTTAIRRELSPAIGLSRSPHHRTDSSQRSIPSQISCTLDLNFLDQTCWNFYVLAMAQDDECVKHALLALSGSYILDYKPNETLKGLVNSHYRKATNLITNALHKPETFTTGQGDNLIAAIVLMLVDDCVNWELRIKGRPPNWLIAAHLAKSILDDTDNGPSYQKPVNIQSTAARVAHRNWVALACILAEPITPLPSGQDEHTFKWLLAGTERETRQIQGGTGLCPKLLHILSQITYLTAMLKEDLSTAPIITASTIEIRLQNFHQWSELSDRCQTVEALLASCKLELDDKGNVQTPTRVTELTGQTWVSTAQIYLHCRFFRKPRRHPDVQRDAKTFLKCLVLMPYTGRLFTSQAPFCPIFIVSLVLIDKQDRDITRNWFETVISGGNCRSSVPPVWEAVQHLWDWFDESEVDKEFDDSIQVFDRNPWWELMVDHLIKTEGYVSLT